MQEPQNIFFKHFASIRGYCSQYLTKFAEQNERFRDVYNYAKSMQESRLITFGLFKKLDAGLVKWVMSVHHGYIDKQVIINQINEADSVLLKIDGNSKDIVNESELN